MVVSAVRATARGEVGGLTSRGRLVRIGVLELPQLPDTANDPHLAGGLPVTEILPLEAGERLLALCTLSTDGPGLALGTRQGTVKRVNPEVLGRDEWEVIRLAEGDEVVGAVELTTGREALCFITSDAQLLHFGADAVRPQGRSGGGIAGIRLTSGERVAWFGAIDPEAPDGSVVVTVSGSSTALPGTEPGAVKVAPFTEYPAKGRATGGVRCHRFLKGEDTLVLAWAGAAPARAAAASGAPVDLPDATGRRDGSGDAGQPADRRVRRPGRGPGPGARGCARLSHVLSRHRRARLSVLALILVALTSAGCDSAGGSNEVDLTPDKVLALARTNLDQTSGVDLTLHTDDLPAGVTGVEDATGVGTHDPAFDGKITVVLSGQAFEVPVVAVDGKVYVQLPLTSGWQDIDPSDYGAPDPARLMSPDRGFSSLLAETSDLQEGDSVRGGENNKEVLTEYSGTVSGDVVKNIIPTASGDFDATYTISDAGELRQARLTGVFYQDSDPMTYTVTFEDYGTQKDITAP